MRVSAIVPFRKGNWKVFKCLDALKGQTQKVEEIIAVSDTDVLDVLGVISILNSNCNGVSDKRNLGASRASGDILFFVDSDCMLREDAVEKLVEIFNRHDTDAVSGKPLAPKKSNLLGVATGLEYEDRFNQMGEGFVTVAATTCLGVKKEAFEKTGGFRDYSKNEATGEDWDFSTRLIKNGYKIYHTNQVVGTHEHVSDKLLFWFKRHMEHMKYRVVHYRQYRKLSDEYSSWKMFLTSSIFLGLPVIFRMYPRTKNPKLFALPFFAFLRTSAWLIGFIDGILE